MTDFGRKAGLGDMLKSVYDADVDDVVDAVPGHKASHEDGAADELDVTDLSGELADNQPAKAHPLAGNKHTASALAELNAKVSDATLDDSSASRTPSAHKTSHQDGGTDEITVAGLVGTTPRAVLADATPGRVLRKMRITIANGTTASTLKCTVNSMWNGDAIAETDNIGLDATTGHFHLSANGQALTILNSGLTGNALDGTISLYYNASGTPLLVSAIKTAEGLVLNHIGLSDGVGLDLTVLVDTGIIIPHILYITDA